GGPASLLTMLQSATRSPAPFRRLFVALRHGGGAAHEPGRLLPLPSLRGVRTACSAAGVIPRRCISPGYFAKRDALLTQAGSRVYGRPMA
ncbi:hypothetical protein, partial [Kitasatospora sp. NPDC001175]